MEMTPLNSEPEPASREDLVESLRLLHARAGKPSLRTLERWAAKNSGHPLARTTVSEMLSGKRLPSQMVLLTFVQACGVPPEGLVPWRQAWERVALAEGPRNGSVERLEHLRRQVTESEESLSRIIAGAERAALESHGQLQQSLTRLESLISEHRAQVVKADEEREESERSFISALQDGIRQLEERHREAERVLERKMQSIGEMLNDFEGRMDRLLKEAAERDAAPDEAAETPERPALLYGDSSIWGDDQDLSPPVIG
ncbi:hypothetical protein [Spirillospora sp. NPDC029432]|uniref:hypothetical protein n=1 Tax=Spirillospora sp. NPDC029432 TaxID=3154599 RepID=UPI0034570074